MPKLGAYSKEIRLAKPDGRTREGRLLRQVRNKLTEELGGKPTWMQAAMIDRAAMLQLRCAALDRRIVDGEFTDYDAKSYLAFTNSLRLILKALGVTPESQHGTPAGALAERTTGRTMADILAERGMG
jgi:hypothetical protein